MFKEDYQRRICNEPPTLDHLHTTSLQTRDLVARKGANIMEELSKRKTRRRKAVEELTKPSLHSLVNEIINSYYSPFKNHLNEIFMLPFINHFCKVI